MMKYRILSLCLLLLLMACSEGEGLPRGEAAPDFTAYDLDGKAYRLSDYRGKVLMLYFWADFCPACEKEFPATNQYYQELKGKDFELLAINVGQKAAVSAGFRQRHGASFPMLLDTASQLSKSYLVEQLPTNYFIDPEGKIIRRINGWVDINQVKIMINQNRKK